MSKTTIAWFLVIAGIIGILAGLLIDVLGLGQHPGLGWKQILSIVAGLVLAGVGTVLLSQRKRAESGEHRA